MPINKFLAFIDMTQLFGTSLGLFLLEKFGIGGSIFPASNHPTKYSLYNECSVIFI
jgi:hypothetical protein